MSEEKIETTKGLCVIALTKHIMEKYKISQDEAFAKLSGTEFFKIFSNAESRLYLEPDYFLFKACDLELSSKTDEMYKYIQEN